MTPWETSHSCCCEVSIKPSEEERETHEVRVGPGVPDGAGGVRVGTLHLAEELIARCLRLGLDDALVLEVGAELVVVPGGVDVVLCVLEFAVGGGGCPRCGGGDGGGGA